MNIIQQIFKISKLLSFFFLYHLLTFSIILEDKSKIYWCYGSFSLDNNLKYFLVSICSSSVLVYIFVFLVLFTQLFNRLEIS